MPRTRPNSRVKDLPDLALIATAGTLEANRLRAAIEQTFTFHDAHDVPEQLPAPPKVGVRPMPRRQKKSSSNGRRLTNCSALRVHSSIRSLRMNQNGDGPQIHGPGQISVYEPRNSASTTHELEQFFSKNHPSAVESHPVFRQNAEHAVITGGWGIARVVEHLGHRGSLSSFGTRSRSNRGPGF